MGMTTVLQNALLEQFFAVPRFLSLHSASPTAAGSHANEVSASGTGYARQALAGKLSAPLGGVVTNVVTITFPVIAGGYPVVTDFGVDDALSGGVMGLTGSFTDASVKTVGQAYQFPPGTIRFQFR